VSLRRLAFTPPSVGAYTPSGSMCEVVTFNIESALDASGNAQAPTTFGTSYANIRALTGRELDKAQQIAQQVSHLVTIPYLAGVKESMTMTTDDGRLFRIQAIEDPDERKVELRILALESGQNA
jgi:SPP1 family predicted phage head-tail adaptor